MSNKKYVIGVDYGTDSVRSVLVDTENGKEISSSVFNYPRWKERKYCDANENRFRQHPLDYLEGLEHTILACLKDAGNVGGQVLAISVDTTGSTPIAINEKGIPLSLTKGFEENPNAMFILWKDHTAILEAEEINTLCHSGKVIDYTQYVGGIYSSEWFFAKVLRTLKVDQSVREAAYSWVEHCDWIPAVLTGNDKPATWKRSRCAAGHKAMWHADYDGLPSESFLSQLNPLLTGLRAKLYDETYTSDEVAGTISAEWASKLQINPACKIGVGAFDAHIGAVGAGIEPFTLTKVMGTSTCDMLTAPTHIVGSKLIKGICGQVDGSIVPNMLGLEAGQSAFGDVYAWFKELLLWPTKNLLSDSNAINQEQKEKLLNELSDKMIPALAKEMKDIPLDETAIVALDWLNGRRTPDANQALKGAISGISLGTDAPRIFKALVEATAFGSKKIVDRFTDEGIEIKAVIALGGVAKKSPEIMQIMADVLDRPIKIARSEQACALGSAMFASVVAGVYMNVDEAVKKMGSGFETEYQPRKAQAEIYKKLYAKYAQLGEWVEGKSLK